MFETYKTAISHVRRSIDAEPRLPAMRAAETHTLPIEIFSLVAGRYRIGRHHLALGAVKWEES